MLPYKKLLLLTLIFYYLLIAGQVFSQIKKNKEVTKPVSIVNSDSTKPLGLYRAQVYFTGIGLPHAISYNSSSHDLNLLMKDIDSASKGGIVSIDYIVFVDSTGKTKNVSERPYNFKRSQDSSQIKSQAVQEVEKLLVLKFISGIVYFSGAGFTNVLSVKATDTSTLYKSYALSRPGTIITLDNCIYKNTNGNLSGPINKSIKLE